MKKNPLFLMLIRLRIAYDYSESKSMCFSRIEVWKFYGLLLHHATRRKVTINRCDEVVGVLSPSDLLLERPDSAG